MKKSKLITISFSKRVCDLFSQNYEREADGRGEFWSGFRSKKAAIFANNIFIIPISDIMILFWDLISTFIDNFWEKNVKQTEILNSKSLFSKVTSYRILMPCPSI